MRKLLIVLLTLAVASVALMANAERAAAAPVGTFVDSLIFFEQPNAAVALQQVSRGTDMQQYMFNLRTYEDKIAALGDPNIWTVQTPGSVNDLWLNPLPYSAGVPGYNPFQLQAVRRAMNYLIDRDFIVNEIYGGFGIPYISPWHSKMPEYRREAAFFQQLDADFDYDPARARTEIDAALGAVAGMVKGTDGKWRHNGVLVTVKFVIRIEDIRLDIGNYVADLLENVGFTVERDYSPGTEAFAKVYNGPPQTGVWNLYTEGFAFTALVAWQDDWLAGFYTDFSGETIWDVYNAPTALNDTANKLLLGQYLSLAERQNLIRTGSRLAVEDGVRVWMVAENTVFIYNERITGAVNDLMAGPWGLFTTRTARYATDGGTMRVGQPLHLNSQWNTYRGFTWLYDATQYRALNDPGIYLHPHTGLPLEIRADQTVTTAGPTGTLALPSDAQIFNATTMTWSNVPAGATATSKVRYDYTFHSWHDGTPITMDDIWYIIASFHRREGGSDRAINPYSIGANDPYPVGDIGAVDPRADSPAVNQWLGLFKGAKQLDADSLEIYADYWHVDEASIGLTLDIFPANPWHVHEIQAATLVGTAAGPDPPATDGYGTLDNRTRFDQSSADTAGRPVIDLIRGAASVGKIATGSGVSAQTSPPGGWMGLALSRLNSTSAVPAGFGTMITATEAKERYTALDFFRKARNATVSGDETGTHYFVSNGPFFLDVANIANKQNTLRRFSGYPYFADHWDSLLAVNIPSVTIGTVGEVVPGLATNIDLSTTLQGVPTSNVQITYLVRNVGLDETVIAGAPDSTGAGTWRIAMDQNTTSRLIPGAHVVQATVLGEQLGQPVTSERSFIVIPTLVYFERLTGQLEAEIGGLGDDLDAAQSQLTQANANIASLSTLLTVAIGIAIVGVIISIVSLAMLMRRGGKPAMEKTMEKAGEEL